MLQKCLGRVQDTILQISSVPYFSDQNNNFTGRLGHKAYMLV